MVSNSSHTWTGFCDEAPWPPQKKRTAHHNSSNRVATFLLQFLEATCDTCATEFPLLSINWSQEDPRWCAFVDCKRSNGTTIRPMPGNASFWRNLHNNYLGDPRTLHAGMPPEKGVKTGLNIWART